MKNTYPDFKTTLAILGIVFIPAVVGIFLAATTIGNHASRKTNITCDITPLFTQNTELIKENAELTRLEEKCIDDNQYIIAENDKYTSERCVCMPYYQVSAGVWERSPKTKDEICNADEDQLFFWEDED